MKLRNFISVIPVALCLMVPAGIANAADELKINGTNFPGAYYQSEVRKYDTDNNGSLSSSEIAACKSLNVILESSDIGALQSFTALTDLRIYAYSSVNSINIDFTKFPNLVSLKLEGSGKPFSQPNFSKLKNLKTLSIIGYKDSTLDISACSSLEDFTISQSNASTVDISKNTNLKKIDVSLNSIDLTKNTGLKEATLSLGTDTVDLSKNTNLTKLVIKSRRMKDISIDHLSKLTWLEFDSFNGNGVYNLNKMTNLEHLSIQHCNVTATDFTKFPKLTYLYLDHSRVNDKSINVSGMANLETLSLYNVKLNSLNVASNTKLKELNIGLTGLTGIDLSKNTALTNLQSSESALTSLNVSKNTALERISLSSSTTTVASLDLRQNTKLKSVSTRKVSSVKIANCPDLSSLYIYEASSFEMGICPSVTYFYCCDCSLESLDLSSCPLIYKAYNTLEKVKNGNYIDVSGKIETEIDGKIETVSCVMRVDAATKVNAESVLVDASIFPDDGFRAAIAEQADTDGDGLLSKAEIKKCTSLDCSNRNVSNLKGLEYFVYLTSLNCSNNNLTSLNTSLLTRLKKLNCSYNQLENNKVNLKNSPIVNLNCSNNKLTTLNGITSNMVEILNASDNQLTGSVPGTHYKKVYLKNNKLTYFDITRSMEYVDISNNTIEYLQYDPFDEVTTGPYALTEIRCQNNKIKSLNFSKLDNLTSCRAYGNPKSTFQLSKTMSDVMSDVKTKKYEGFECVVLGDKFILDAGNEYTYYVKVSSENFPDPGLLKAVKNIDLDNDGYLDPKEADPKSFDCSNMGIRDLTGLELLTIHDLDCSFNELKEFDYAKLKNNYVSHKVTCYGNPDLDAVMIGSYMREMYSKEEKTDTIKVGGKDVVVDYDSYADYRKEVVFNVDRGCRLVGTPVYLTVVIPEGAGEVTGDGMYEKGSQAEPIFTPAKGVVFAGWYKDGVLVCKTAKCSFKIDEDCTLEVKCLYTQDLSFPEKTVARSLVDKPFTIEVSGAKTAVEYSCSDSKIAEVDAKTGKVTLKSEGECVITAKAAASDKYVEASASYKLIVNLKPTATPTATPTPTPKPAKPTATSAPKVTATPKVTSKPGTTVVPEDPKAQILAFVERIYIYVLDREPEAEGAAFWSEELYSFRRTGAEVAQGFIFSDEFVNRNTSDKEFVTILYKTFFGRDPEEEGMNFWLNQLATGTMDRFTVANGFIYSQEWADTCASYGIRSGGDLKPTGKIAPTELTYAFVERMYTTALGRGYDEEGKQYWASELANFNITGENCGASFFLSEEMENYKLSDKEYLGRLYATFMNREPDADGEAYWLGVMASGASRADVVFGFTRSAEFTDKCVEARILPY